MEVSLFSFIMAVLWSSVLIIFLYIGRRQRFFLRCFGVPSMTLLYVFSAMRMIFPFEFPFTIVIPNDNVYRCLWELFSKGVEAEALHMEIYEILLIVWGAVTVFLSLGYMIRYSKLCIDIRKFLSCKDPRFKQAIGRIQQDHKTNFRIKIICDPAVPAPMSFGILRRCILLPHDNYTDKELHYILLHEYTHLKTWDHLAKLLIKLFCYIFWWNPVSYLLTVDIEQTFELKCDLNVSKNLSDDERGDYLMVIIKEFKKSFRKKNDKQMDLTLSLVKSSSDAFETRLRERAKLIAEPVRYDHKKQWIALALAVLLLGYLSYAFIFQSEYPMPNDEYGVEEGAYRLEIEDFRLVQNPDGDYQLVGPQGATSIQKENAEFLLESGVEFETE